MDIRKEGKKNHKENIIKENIMRRHNGELFKDKKEIDEVIIPAMKVRATNN